MRVSVIGAGSSYTPEIIEGLAARREQLHVEKVTLMDVQPERLEVMAQFCRRYLRHLGVELPIEATLEREQAIQDADFILTQFRVGGNALRTLDEKIPLRYGVIGQETTGPGGMFKALRTIPVMLEIARDVERLNPRAWTINYTNPTGMVAEAVARYTGARFAGLCSGGLFPRWWVSQALGVPPESVRYDYFGLNHLNFAYNIRVDGRALNDEEFARAARAVGSVDAELITTLRLLPSPYLQYYFHRREVVKKAQAKPLTRGEEVQQLESEIFRAYADERQVDKPAALAKRGGGGYSEVALGVIEAIHADQERSIVVNVPQRGAVAGFPPEAVFELPCLVRGDGIHPLMTPEIPRAVWGLVAAVKNYEQLAVEAAVTGARETALLALLAHPLVADIDVARPLLEEMLAANRAYLPQFFGAGQAV